MRVLSKGGSSAGTLRSLRVKQRALCLSLITLVAHTGSAAADVVIDANAAAQNKPRLDTTASGVPLAQITAPSPGGVSRNQYQTFSVDPQGLILNNARVVTQTQLGGYVEGNANLAGGSARIILNEVTSANPSLMRGFTEIAGQRAELVLANPNGITCSGCGFINTSRAVFATGTPVFGADGGLDAFHVTGGRIGIEGQGLNATGVDQVDLLARAVSVNAGVWANTLNVITGANQIRHDDLGVTPLTPDGHRPGVALDVGALGGMYANRIRLIGTEAGVGVVSRGTLAANAGDFTLSNEGRIEISGQTIASGNVAITTPESLINQGAILAQGGTAVIAAGDAVNNSGRISAAQGLTLTTAILSNTGGMLTAGTDIVLATQGIDGGGALTAGRDLRVDALGDILFGSGDVASANGLFTLTAQGNITNNGSLSAGTFSARGGQFTNLGRIAGNALSLHSTQFTNQGSVAGNALSIDTGGLTNQGAGSRLSSSGRFELLATGDVINRDGGAILGHDLAIHTRTLSNQGAGTFLGSAGSLDINALGGVSNLDGATIQGGDLTLNASSLTNQGAGSHLLSSGLLDLNITGAVNNLDGATIQGGDLTLNASSLINQGAGSRLISSGQLQLQVSGDVVNLDGAMIQGNDLTLNAHTLTNDGAASLIGATAGLHINTVGGLTNSRGAVIKGHDLMVYADSLTNQNAGSGLSATDLLDFHIMGDVVNRDGAAILGHDLAINAYTLTNEGATSLIGATGDIDLNIAHALTNRDRATIFSLGDITIAGSDARDAGGLPLVRTGSLLNESATIEATGDLNIWADQLVNRKRAFEFGEVQVSQEAKGPIDLPFQSPYISAQRNYIETITETQITADSPAAQLLAGNDITLNLLGQADNLYSVIAAGHDLNFDTSIINNTSTVLTRTTTQIGADDYVSVKKKCRYRGPLGGCVSAYDEYTTDSIPYSYFPPPVELATVPSSLEFNAAQSFFTAGHDITGVLDTLNNTSVTPITALVGGVTGSLVGTPNLSTDLSGLYHLNSAPGATYLIQTHALFTDFATFMSSDYMMQRLGVNFGDNQKRLGDGFYEQKLVQDQVLQLTGRRFLAGYGSNESEFLALMDAGVSVAERFDLMPGVSLAANQIAALTSDIVWLEERQVAGQQVLVPVVYLASVHKNDLDGFGPLIAAENINLKLSGDLTNGGTLAASRMLKSEAANIVNRGGTIAGGGTVYLAAGNDLLNQSGTIKGGDVQIDAGRDFRHETVFQYIDHGNTQTTAVGRTGTIETTGNLDAHAGRDLNITAATVTAGQDAALDAGRDLTLDAAAKHERVAVLFKSGSYEHDTTENMLSSVTSGGNTVLHAGNDATLRGAQIAAGQDLTIAARNVTLAAVNDRELLDTSASQGHGNSTRQRNDDETVRGSFLAAGNNLTLSAHRPTEGDDHERHAAELEEGQDPQPDTRQGNLLVEGSRISAGARLTLTADQDVVIRKAREYHESLSEKRDGKKGSVNSWSTYERTHETADLSVGSDVSGLTVIADAGTDITVQGSRLASAGDMAVTAGHDINILAAKDTYVNDSIYEEKHSGFNFKKHSKQEQEEKQNEVKYSASYSKSRYTSHSTEESESSVGSHIGSLGGSVTINAGGDYRQTGSVVTADDTVSVMADTIAIEEARNNYVTTNVEHQSQKGLSIDWYNSSMTNGGMDYKLTFGSQKEHTQLRQAGNTNTASSVSASDIVMTARNGDLGVRGATLSGQGAVLLSATGNVDIGTSVEQSSVDYTQDKRSHLAVNMVDGSLYGLFHSDQRGTASIKTKTKHVENQGDSLKHSASNIESGSGGVRIHSDKDIHITGSHITSGADIDAQGKKIVIDAATNRELSKDLMEEVESGLTLSFGSPILDAIDKATSAKKRSEQVDDGRLKALYQYRAARSAVDAVFGNEVKGDTGIAQAVTGGGFSVSVSVSYGVDKKKSESESETRTAEGSSLMAKDDVKLTATGPGPVGGSACQETATDANATCGNIDIIGSKLDAGNIRLSAANDINLLSAEDYARFASKDTSSSSSVGVGFSLGANTGFSLSLSHAQSKGKINTESVSHDETLLTARDTLDIDSGNDTTLKGAQVRGEKIVADIGGDLNLESEQDTEKYLAKQQSMSAGITIPLGVGTNFSINFSSSKSKTNSDYRSVQEQTGLFAGTEGFDIHVGHNTDLKGAVIASTADASNNRLSTGTLTFSDIENIADAKATSKGVSLSSDMLSGNYGAAKGVIENIANQGAKEQHDASTTHAAVSLGMIEIRQSDEQTQDLADLSRDVENAHRALVKPNTSTLKREAEEQREIRKLTVDAVEGFTDEARRGMFVVPANKVLKVTCRQEPCAYDDKDKNPESLDPNRKVDGQPNIAYEEVDPRSIPQDGKIRLAINGIFNNKQRAAELAMQNTPVDKKTGSKPDDLYVLYYPKTNNFISELMVAGYEKFMAPTFGYTNPTWLAAEVLSQQGANNVLLEGHSRGSLVVNNALTLLGEQGYKNPSLGVNVYGPAVGEGRINDSFNKVAPPAGATEDAPRLGYIYDTRDPVATFTGGAKDGSYVGSIVELWDMVVSNNSTHSCYGTGAPGCKPFRGPVSGAGGNP